LGVLTYKVGHKSTTHKQRFGHVNATNRNSYLNIICISYTSKKTKIQTLIRVFRFSLKKLKFRLEIIRFFKPTSTALGVKTSSPLESSAYWTLCIIIKKNKCWFHSSWYSRTRWATKEEGN